MGGLDIPAGRETTPGYVNKTLYIDGYLGNRENPCGRARVRSRSATRHPSVGLLGARE